MTGREHQGLATWIVVLAVCIGVLIPVLSLRLSTQNDSVESYISKAEGRVTFLSWSNSNGELDGDGYVAWWSEEQSELVVENLSIGGFRHRSGLELTVTYPDGSTRRINGVDTGSIAFSDPVGDGSSNTKIFSPSTKSEYLKVLKDLRSP